MTRNSSRTKVVDAVTLRPVFDARTMRAVILLCCGLSQHPPRLSRPHQPIDRASYRRALDDVMNRCLAHLPYAKGATREERKQAAALDGPR